MRVRGTAQTAFAGCRPIWPLDHTHSPTGLNASPASESQEDEQTRQGATSLHHISRNWQPSVPEDPSARAPVSAISINQSINQSK